MGEKKSELPRTKDELPFDGDNYNEATKENNTICIRIINHTSERDEITDIASKYGFGEGTRTHQEREETGRSNPDCCSLRVRDAPARLDISKLIRTSMNERQKDKTKKNIEKQRRRL